MSANPSHALGWLYLGTVNAFRGDGNAAMEATSRAMELSPLDPQRYYFESLAATAALSAHQYGDAERLARSSLTLNRMHTSTWRVLTIALVSQERMKEARAALGKLRELEPELTVERYLGRMPNARTRNRPALGAVPGHGGIAVGKRQLEPALMQKLACVLVEHAAIKRFTVENLI